MDKNENKLIGFLFVYVVLFYLSGFIVPDSIIGYQIKDEVNYHLPTIKHFAEQPSLSALRDYPSATFPLYHILYAFLYKGVTHNVHGLRFFNFLTIVLTSILIYFYFLKTTDLNKNEIGLIVISFLSSPFLRGSGFALTTDALPYLFILLSLLVLYYGGGKKIALHVLACFFAFCAFYTRQFYFWLPMIVFSISLVKMGRNHRLMLVLANTVFILPAVYLAHLWGGLTPPSFQIEHQSQNVLLILPFIFANIPFYFFPVVLYKVIQKKPFKKPDFQKSFMVLSLCLVYVLAYTHFRFNLHVIYGGFFPKVFGLLSPQLGQPVFLIFSFCGLVILLYYLKQNFFNNVYLVFIVGALSMSQILFQKYVDPLLVLLVFLFYDKKSNGEFIHTKTVAIYPFMEMGLWIATLVYYGMIYPKA